MEKVWILCFLFFFSTNSYGQIDWNKKIRKASKQESRSLEIKSLSNLIGKVPRDSSIVIGNISYLISHRYKSYFKTQADSILKYSEIGIEAFEKVKYLEYKLSRLREYRGKALVAKGNVNEGFKTYDDFDNLIMEDDRAIGSYLMSKVDQAQIFRDKGDNEAGIQLLEYAESLPFFDKAFHLDKFRFYFEKAVAYGIEDTEEYNVKCDSALFLATKFTTTAKQKLSLDQQKGKIFINQHLYPEAILAYESVFQKRLNLKTNFDSLMALDALNNVSHCMILSDNSRSAIDLLTKYIPVFFKSNIDENRKLKIYDNLLSAYIKTNQIQKTDSIIKIANDIITENKSLKTLKPHDIAIYQFDKASYYYEQYIQSDKNILFADKALHACHKMDEAIIDYEKNLITNKAQYLAKKIIDPFYKLPIEITGKLNNQEDFFYFSERSKNNLLFQELNNSRYNLLREFDLLQAIKNNTEDVLKLNKELVEIRKEKLDFLFLEEKRTYSEISSLPNFIEKIGGKFCLNYSFGKSNLYLQTIDSKGLCKLYDLGNCFSKEEFQDFYKKVISESDKQYNKGSSEFIEHLTSIKIDTTSILILPDEYLFLFPFDILNTEYGPLYNFDHSYELNASLFSNRAKNTSYPIINNSVIVNPSYKKEPIDSSLQNNGVELFELPYSYTDADGIKDYLKMDNTKTNIKPKIQSSYLSADLFHFSGHAILDDNELFSYLPLDAKGSNLYAYEFNNWNTNAQLVVLSACETGSGKIAAGEGVLSFSRSIIKSGAKSVVSTLWPVNDLSTSKIISKFYSNLSNGNSKSKALSKAKQEFLNTCPDFQKHPYYWAGITITGDNSPIIFDSPTKFHWIWLLISAVLIVISLIVIRKIKN